MWKETTIRSQILLDTEKVQYAKDEGCYPSVKGTEHIRYL